LPFSEDALAVRAQIITRLKPDDIVDAIARAEARQEAWVMWAIFWMSLGAILGIAGCLLVISLWGKF